MKKLSLVLAAIFALAGFTVAQAADSVAAPKSEKKVKKAKKSKGKKASKKDSSAAK